MSSSISLDLTKLCVEKHVLDVPPLKDIAKAFKSKLSDNFDIVNAEVVDCPDLKKEPFCLAGSGLGGNPHLIDVGGPPFLLPLVDRTKVYDLRSIAPLACDENSFIIGPGGGPWPHTGTNCELIVNSVVNKDCVVVAGNRVAKIDYSGKQIKQTLEKLPASEWRCALMANIFSCRGESGQVVKVYAKKRIGELDFLTSLRTALESCFPDQVIGMGGTFLVSKGKTWVHIMPDFSKKPLNSNDDVDKWLNFFDVDPPQVFVGTFISKDPGLDLRVQHFHGYGKNDGGHYHYDTTPNDVECVAYLSTASTLLRIDKPVQNTGVGFN